MIITQRLLSASQRKSGQETHCIQAWVGEATSYLAKWFGRGCFRVKWVSVPTLCYYELLIIWKNVHIELLVPEEEAPGCGMCLSGE